MSLPEFAAQHSFSNNGYGVWCEVDGGYTGNKRGWLKNSANDDGLARYETYEEARDEARSIRKNISPNGRAVFRYTARKF